MARAKKGIDVKFKFNLDPAAINYFARMPDKLQQAREKAVTAAGMAWADGAKSITRSDGHVDTGLYVNSIGYNSGSPATEADVIKELQSSGDQATLSIGSAVEYAAALEKRYNIFARALDTSKDRMQTVAETQIKRQLF